MRKIRWFGLFIFLWLPLGQVHAQGWRNDNADLPLVNSKLTGKIVDYTNNHGHDNRIWSRNLFQRRDLYVYLPPNFDPHQPYPLMIWMHGICSDEKSFLYHVAPVIDEAIRAGKLPPLIVAAPDGSFTGEPHPAKAGTFFLNSEAGDFANFVLYDVFDFLMAKYPIRPERQAHVLAGCSMGGFAAFNLGIKHREAFGVVIGICPPLNLRWQNKAGNYQAKFDPRDWSWRTELGNGSQPVTRWIQAAKKVTLGDWFGPLYGIGPEVMSWVASENPIEMIDRYRLQPGELEMYVGFSTDDEFNIDAQVESFLYLAQFRHLNVGVGVTDDGRHCIHTFVHLLPHALDWLTPRLAPFSPLMPGGGIIQTGAIVADPVATCAIPAPAACAVCPGAGKASCPSGAAPAPKHRLFFGHKSQPAPAQGCDDLNCHLPPLWLPDRLPEEDAKQ